MSNFTFNEASYENALIELFQDKLGYEYTHGKNIVRDFREPLLVEKVFASLSYINASLPNEAIHEAIGKIKALSSRDLLGSNEKFTDYLQNGVEVSYINGGKPKTAIVKLIDFDNINKNDFLVVNQYKVEDNSVKIPDIVVFVNGFPLVDIELKSCSREETDSSEAYNQIRNRLHDIPSLYVYNALCIISDMVTTKAGTISSSEDRYMEWKSITGDYEETKYASFETLFEGIFDKKRFLELLKSFTMFSKGDDDYFKVFAGYHQYFAVKKAVRSTLSAIETDGKAGVVWHTQGSGKSFSMVFYAKLLNSKLNNSTIVVITDRNDLDNQLYETFCASKQFLRQTPVQASDREDLKLKLKGRASGGIIFTTMQKFEESEDCLSDRSDIILIADEAHRSQYGLDEKINKDGKITIGYARLVRNSLPNATFIGFTGTPIDDQDRSTREIFGNYIDIYDITQAVEDKATKPIFYESRIMKLSLDEEVLKRIDSEYEIMSANAESYHIEKSKQQLATLEEILGGDKTIATLASDFIAHYSDRSHLLTGKAMFVAYSRAIGIKLYEEILRQKPDWVNKVKVVMTGANKDPEGWKSIIGTDANKKALAKEFKDNNSEFKIALVVDMWLTGFDVPSLATMYVFKPMQGHNLMQAIARVNRVFKDKEGGLIVDYIGIAGALKKAMKAYTSRDKRNHGDNDISKKALPLFIEKLEICRNFMHGFDYSPFMQGGDLERAQTITGGINHIVANEENKKAYIKEALALHQSMTLCLSLLDYDTRIEAAFMEAVRVAITRIVQSKKLSLKDINDKIAELLKHSIKDSDVINIFGSEDIRFSIFDKKYIDSLAKMKEKNLALELLARLLKDQIKIFERTNLVQSELFSQKMQRIMNSFINGQITNAEVLEELRNLAEEMRANDTKATELGLTVEEKAFYDALLKPEALKHYYEDKNDDLINIVKELTDMLNKNRTIDWQNKETARSDMRSMVRRLLKKYKYPPDEIPNATAYVIAQCERFADNLEE